MHTITVQQFETSLEAHHREMAATLSVNERGLFRAMAHASDPAADGIAVEEWVERTHRMDTLRAVTGRLRADGFDVAARNAPNAPGGKRP